MENLKILIFKSLLLGLTPLREARKNISHSISLFLTIIDLKVVLRELLGLANLARAQTLCIYILTEVFMVSESKNLIFAAFQVVTPSFKGFNDG